MANDNPPGWWKISTKGTREGVLKAIDAEKDIPDEAKTFLKARVAAVDEQFNHIALDAHCQMFNQKHARSGDVTAYHEAKSYSLAASKQAV